MILHETVKVYVVADEDLGNIFECEGMSYAIEVSVFVKVIDDHEDDGKAIGG